MAGFSTYIIFTSVLCQLTVTAASRTLKEVAGALDGSVTFTLNITEIKVDYVVWAFNTFFLAMVKDNDVTSQRRKEGIIFPDGHYSMKLSQLKKNDSGAYRAEIHSSSTETPFIQEFVLQVYEYLSRPTVTMDWQSNENGTCIINLTCSMDQEGENVMYSWKAVGGNEFHDGANLPISWRSGEKDKTLICMARNPVSNSSSTPIFVQKLCEDSAKDLNSPRGILYILFIAAVFIPLSALVIIIHARWAQKGKGLEEDEKRVESHPEMPNSCPHLEENTAYDTIPYIEKRRPEEDAANTLYSTVQIPKEVKSPSSLPAKPHTLRPLSFENVI